MPPLQAQSLARAMGSAASSIAGAFELRGEQAEKKWHQLAQYLEYMAQDPNTVRLTTLRLPWTSHRMRHHLGGSCATFSGHGFFPGWRFLARSRRGLATGACRRAAE